MQSDSLVLINVTPMLPDHVDEVVEDLIRLWEARAISSVAFMCPLVPEGDPPHDKAARLAELFARYRDAISPCGLPTGILLQSTMGHGWTPNEVSHLQGMVLQDGTQPYVFCPLDPDFLSYVFDAVRTLAEQRPYFMMLEDDTRMITGRGGCFCPLHLAEFNARRGTSHTRESMVDEVYAMPDTARAYDELLSRSIVGLAETVRKAIDAVDADMPCSFCLCADDIRHAPSVARTLAAPGHAPTVRINHALYKRDSPRMFLDWRLKTSQQRTWLPAGDVVLAEPDTCPHNRYSMSAAFLHAHVTWSLLEGLRGAVLWLARLPAWEPGSGSAYREVVRRHAGFYRALAALRPEWISICEPLPETPPLNFPCRSLAAMARRNWGSNVLGRMGIPYHYASWNRPGPKLLAGSDVDALTDDALRGILSGRVLLDGSAALALSERGFASWIGAEAEPWRRESITFEAWDGGSIPSQGAAFADLRGRENGCAVLSRLLHAPHDTSGTRDELGPGMLLWDNEAGGTVATMAACIMDFGNAFTAFNMLCERRKAQLVSLLSRLNALPVYVPGDPEVMLNAGRLADGRYLVAGLNVGLDPLASVPLAGSVLSEVSCIEALTPDGIWEPRDTSREQRATTLDLPVAACTPFVLRITPSR